MVKFDFLDNGTVHIQTHYDQKDRCAMVPGGRWVPRIRSWEYQLTPATASAMCQAFSNELSDEDRQKLQNIAAKLSLARSVKEGDFELQMPTTNFPPWHHQLVSYNMAKQLFGLDCPESLGGGALLGLDMGCGKSKCTVDIITNHPNQIRTVLVVCPASVIDVWTGNEDRQGQFEIHAVPEAYKNMVICAVKGKDLTKKTTMAEQARFSAEHQNKQFVAVINYESAWREPFASWAKEVGFDLVVADEVHRIKSAGGKASKFFGQLGKTAKCRLGLTGTPLPHAPTDIFGQYRFLDPGIFGTSFTKFRSDYAVMGGFQGHQILSYRNQEMLHNKIFLIGYRVMSKDVFDLPEFLPDTRTCELSPEERRIYRQMDTEFYAEIESGEVTAANALVKLLRLQEITSGYLDKQPIGDSKKKLLADVMEDFDPKEPLVVFARFTNDLRAVKEVAEAQGRKYAELSGSENQLSQWQVGNYDVLGVQIQSGKEGVDFTRARYSIYYSLGFSLGDYEQTIKRLGRPGQLRAGMYIHLLAKESVDFKVMKALEQHRDVVASVLDQYKGINEPDDVKDDDLDDKYSPAAALLSVPTMQ